MALLAIPTLETPRLILRGYKESDAPAIARMHGNAEVVHFLGGETDDSLRGAWDHIAFAMGHWAFKGYGKWAAVERASGRLIGRIGFLNPPYDWPGLELGWVLARDAWGKGYATEGARAALDWGFSNIASDTILSIIPEGNDASIRVAERLGETLQSAGMFHEKPCKIFGITRDAWRKQART